MPRSRQGVGAAVGVLLALSMLGCTGGRPGASRSELQGDGGTDATIGAPLGPGSRKDQPKALGAPIKVPAFQQIGAPIGEVFGSIEAEFVAACGGQLCVTLVIRPADADPESCGFAGTDPPAGTTVKRDTTVALVCNPAPTDTGDTTPPADTTPSDDSQPTSSS
jgi:hypothetical protein